MNPGMKSASATLNERASAAMKRGIFCLLLLLSGISFAVIRPGALLKSAREDMEAGRLEAARVKADSVRSLASSPLTQIEALVLLADINRNLGKFDLTEKAYDDAQKIFKTSDVLSDYFDPATPDGLNYANLLLNRAQFELSAGRFDECERSLEKAHFLKGSEGELRRSGTYASLYYRKGDSAKALKILDKAIEGATGSPTLAVLLQNRGYILSEEGRHDEAVSDFRKALELSQSPKDKSIVKSNLATALSKNGNADESISLINSALEEMESSDGKESKDYLTILRKKAEIYLRGGREAEARSMMRSFFSGERDRLRKTLAGLNPQMRLDYWVQEKPYLSEVFFLGQDDPELMMDIAVMRRETSLPDIKGNGGPRISATHDDVRKLLKDGEAAVAIVLHPALDGEDEYSAVILPHKGKTRFVPLSKASYFRTEGKVGNMSVEEALITEDPAAKNKLYTDSLLGEMVWRPIIDALPTGIKTLHFAPEGIFHLWGIENMPFEKSEDYKIIRHFSLLEIRTPEKMVSGKSLLAGGLDYNSVPEEESGTTESESDHSAYSELSRSLGLRNGEPVFSYLPGTAREISGIAGVIGSGQAETELSEDDFKGKAPENVMLHIATHGYSMDSGLGTAHYLPADSLAIDISLLRSGIALSGANVLGTMGFKEDGILSAREICDLDLSNVDLVVLSACQTAKGFITDESASGLIRALKIAGVKTIVASLWEVDDNATTLFMTSFHKLLNAGLPRDEAFRAARDHVASYSANVPVRRFDPASLSGKEVTHISKHPYKYPWYWAPFIMIDP